MAWLRDLTDEAFLAVQADPVPVGDVSEADKRARAVVNLARAVKAVMALEAPAARAGRTETSEDEMSEHREPNPERLAAKPWLAHTMINA